MLCFTSFLILSQSDSRRHFTQHLSILGNHQVRQFDRFLMNLTTSRAGGRTSYHLSLRDTSIISAISTRSSTPKSMECFVSIEFRRSRSGSVHEATSWKVWRESAAPTRNAGTTIFAEGAQPVQLQGVLPMSVMQPETNAAVCGAPHRRSAVD